MAGGGNPGLRGLGRLGRIPAEAAEKIRAGARFSVQRILELEKSTRHDVIAFTRCVAESLGPESRYLHYGLTSSDVVDTAASCQLAEAVDIIDAGLAGLLEVLARQADKHRYRDDGAHPASTPGPLPWGSNLPSVPGIPAPAPPPGRRPQRGGGGQAVGGSGQLRQYSRK